MIRGVGGLRLAYWNLGNKPLNISRRMCSVHCPKGLDAVFLIVFHSFSCVPLMFWSLMKRRTSRFSPTTCVCVCARGGARICFK